MANRCLLACLFLAGMAFLVATAAICAQPTADDHLLVLASLRDGTLQVQAGEYKVDLIRVFSEPSHTLLAVFVDQAFVRDGQRTTLDALLKEDSAAPMLVVPGLSRQLSIPVSKRPSNDDRIIISVLGTPPNAVAYGEKAVAKVKTHGNEFGFAHYYNPRTATSLSCCSSDKCGQVCTTCDDGEPFSCCMLGPPQCCFINCGWANTDCLLCTCWWCGCYMNGGC